MTKLFLALAFTFATTACTTQEKRHTASEASPTPWFIEKTYYKISSPIYEDIYLRTGFYREAQPLKGCILYLEGLGDSISNQAPLFNYLSQSGYRVIFFDFMGQGDSGGSMNNTRIVDPLKPALEILTQARFVWEKYANKKDDVTGQDCSHSKKLVIGWSTGGLAAYALAHQEWADAVALIAPGLHVKSFVGESATDPTLLLKGVQVITERTLTRNTFARTTDPHIDAIKPISPGVVPLFAGNLWLSSQLSQTWKISSKIPGIVFLSGTNDTYVDRDGIAKTVKKNASHFKTSQYEGALHELQNEMPEVSTNLYEKTIGFFNSITEAATEHAK